MKKTAQALMGDRRFIAEYESSDHVPYPLDRPLTPSELAPYAGTDKLVTFTVRVPLDVVVRAGQDSTVLSGHIAKGFLGLYSMNSAEYRAVGATFEDFGHKFSGLVHLQVTCAIGMPE